MIKRIIFDFDETLVNTIDGFLKIANKKYGLNATDTRKYNFTDVIPSEIPRAELFEIFDSWDFINELTLKENTLETLSEIAKNYPIQIVTMGSVENYTRKEKWFREVLRKAGYGYLNEDIEWHGVNVKKYKDKAHIDMRDCLFADDHQKNLFTSNATIKVLFENRKDADWNCDWTGERISDITQIYQYLVKDWGENFEN